MRSWLFIFAVLGPLALFAADASAQSNTLQVTVTYRERIALPPDAELEVQLLGQSREAGAAKRLSSQRFAMTGVPQSVELAYDPGLTGEMSSYVVVATIWASPDRQLFRTTESYSLPENGHPAPVDLILTMVPGDAQTTAAPRTISGIEWVVTEIAGERWSNDDPASLTIDDQMAFFLFAGCNRFVGQLMITESEITFPANFAGTMMACPGEAETLERQVLEILQRVSRFVRYGSGLVLTDADGAALLHLRERPE